MAAVDLEKVQLQLDPDKNEPNSSPPATTGAAPAVIGSSPRGSPPRSRQQSPENLHRILWSPPQSRQMSPESQRPSIKGVSFEVLPSPRSDGGDGGQASGSLGEPSADTIPPEYGATPTKVLNRRLSWGNLATQLKDKDRSSGKHKRSGWTMRAAVQDFQNRTNNVGDDFAAQHMEEDMKAVFTDVYLDDTEDTSDNDPLLAAMKYIKKKQEDLKKAGRNGEKQVDQDQRFGIMLDEDDISTLMDELKQQQSLRKWMMFDAFFGAIVLANGAIEAASAEKLVDSEDPWFVILMSVFTVCFIVEFCIRWYFAAGGFCELMRDGWLRFDLFIIVTSAFDQWVGPSLGASGGSGAAILRIARMVRFVRLLRLLKKFKNIWYLVSGMIQSTSILLWTVLMLLVNCYIFGLLFVEMVGQSSAKSLTNPSLELKDDPVVKDLFGGIGTAMLTLLQIATYDNSMNTIRYIVEGQYQMRWVGLLFAIFITIGSLGFFNLMVGVLLTSALDVTRVDEAVMDSCDKILRHEALGRLQDMLSRRCETQIGCAPGQEFITRNMLIAWMSEVDWERRRDSDKSVKQLLSEAGVLEEDVHAIFLEVGKIQGTNHPSLTVDDFIQGCYFIQSEVHVLHMCHVVAGQASMFSRLESVDEYLTGLANIIEDALAQLRPSLKKYYSPRAMNVWDKEENQDGDEEPKRQEVLVVSAHRSSQSGKVLGFEVEVIAKTKKERNEMARWGKFDGVFILIVGANAICIGIDCTRSAKFERNFVDNEFGEQDFLWLILEAFFYVAFVIEFVLRSIYYYQMRYTGTFETFMCVLPVMLFNMHVADISKVIHKIPKMLSEDLYVCFDVLLILLGTVDNLILRFFFTQPSYIIILRLFRGLRLLRIARILYLFHELVQLLGSVLQSVPVVLWTVVMLSGFLYIGAVFVGTIIFPEIPLGSESMQKFPDLLGSSITLLQCATFGSWGDIGEKLADDVGSIWCYAFIAFFSLYVGLGVMNLTTGVVVQASFSVVAKLEDDRKTKALAEMKVAAVSATDRMHRFFKDKEERRKSEAIHDRVRKLRMYMKVWKLVHEASIAQTDLRPKEKEHADAGQLRSGSLGSIEEEDDVVLDDQEMSSALNLDTYEGDWKTNGGGTNSSMPDGMMQVDRSQTLHPIDELVGDIVDDFNCDTKMLMHRNVDDSVLTTTQFWYVMKDPLFLRDIKACDIRPDQVLMLFQKLDSMSQGCIAVNDFVEGLNRMKKAVQGVDVSSAKSMARRMHLTANAVNMDASQLHECFLRIVSDLRGITLTGSEKQLEDALDARPSEKGDMEEENLAIHAQELLLTEENRRMRMKINKLEDAIERRVAIGEKNGDQFVGAMVGIEVGDSEEELSITSAKSGLD